MLLKEFLDQRYISLEGCRDMIRPITAEGFSVPSKSTLSEWSHKGYTVQLKDKKNGVPEILRITPPSPQAAWKSTRDRSVWQSKRYRGIE